MSKSLARTERELSGGDRRRGRKRGCEKKENGNGDKKKNPTDVIGGPSPRSAHPEELQNMGFSGFVGLEYGSHLEGQPKKRRSLG